MILYYEGCLSSGERDICSGLSSKKALRWDRWSGAQSMSTQRKQLGWDVMILR
jgi:hypothetical protein